ncbi:MAG: sugar isomerase domain-containing protein [Candidatus Abyssobacteria bacterium SURF_17]|uniref:Sugar isomerase domain-containing protein n=1 Tax=Candidatus Abyssobacteria bacterium SURF_17 TaxID=2093361 RepID=A0A419ENS5_9BACT|nr:MAG: sugar isomerase domain-containing protein [Candidatus Abyssubacteria bacterium SURF_17]
MMNEYYEKITSLLDEIHATQAEAIAHAGAIVGETIRSGGIVHTFGSGHSGAIAYEAHGRAGGLAAVGAITDPLRGLAEKVEGYGRALMAPLRPGERDSMIVISNSGRNSLPIEVAMVAKEKGLKVIAITSLAHSRSVTSRHSSGKRLFELADVVIDNRGDPGDASVTVEGLETPVGPTSTITGAYIMNEITIAAVCWLLDHGIEPPVFRSANLDGSKEHNDNLRSRYTAPRSMW